MVPRQRQSYNGLNQWFFPFSERNTQKVYWLLKLIFTSESYRFRVPHILSEYKSEMDGERPRRQSGEKKNTNKNNFYYKFNNWKNLLSAAAQCLQQRRWSRKYMNREKKTPKKVLPSRAAYIISRQLVRITIVYGQTSHYSIFMMIRATVWISNDFCYDANRIDAAKCTPTHTETETWCSAVVKANRFCFLF